MENSHRFFRNNECRYFPCHDTSDEFSFNCLFCFCPLYLLEDCGGRYELTNGIKNCTRCKVPHRPDGYDYIIKKLKQQNSKLI
ncbi:cysteine-rich small domain-containing protein [Maridesulfovibrio hydrothermalis]|uniref:Cysteine-rich small domain protein n=1 Tax=Maridesulfovibrio hydrothermalis AM13 = DSM 14728 TaxID=1121451 RepID=L0R965_9BACT|nr:cysteine-rich small domain-containing protein [Maridesulfovibrio hydrothermalis]CCO22762.1 Cysteine-rich small domain protein [Maridesulfovibrio hydrothermalis AM13 = DSM 14728]